MASSKPSFIRADSIDECSADLFTWLAKSGVTQNQAAELRSNGVKSWDDLAHLREGDIDSLTFLNLVQRRKLIHLMTLPVGAENKNESPDAPNDLTFWVRLQSVSLMGGICNFNLVTVSSRD